MSLDRGFDRLLDRSILLGYSRIGFALRSRIWPRNDPAAGSMNGRTALVTGAAGGLGESTALELARLGARVHLLVRSVEKAAATVDRIKTELESEIPAVDIRIERCDVSDPASVTAFAENFCARDENGTVVDVLVHNAGVMPSSRSESLDGHELTVATHVLGPVLLTEKLLPAMRRSIVGARVVMIASGGMYTQPLPVSDPDFRQGGYKGAVAYARSKRMQVELTGPMAARWAKDRISVHSMHPGWADTPGLASAMPKFRFVLKPLLRSAAQGTETAVWLAASTEAMPSGTFWHDRSQRPTSYLAATHPDSEAVEQLWNWVLDQLGLEAADA